MANRTLFCELSPVTYKISVAKCCALRTAQDAFARTRFARTQSDETLPVLIYTHSSLVCRRLGGADMRLQQNKAVNLALAAPKVNGILIRPGECFSFWKLVGRCTAEKGYKEGLTISKNCVGSGIGGGMCQFTNLLHWLVLHSPLTITEHHHHDGVDLFPDYGRKVPFGLGTSIFHNYRDYRFTNNTPYTFQLCVRTDGRQLHGELRADVILPTKYHIRTEGDCFVQEADGIYRCGKIWRRCIDKRTGNTLSDACIKTNHARVQYEVDPARIEPSNPHPKAG